MDQPSSNTTEYDATTNFSPSLDCQQYMLDPLLLHSQTLEEANYSITNTTTMTDTTTTTTHTHTTTTATAKNLASTSNNSSSSRSSNPTRAVKRSSKQLPRLFVAMKRLSASTRSITRGKKEKPSEEPFPLPSSFSFLNSTNTMINTNSHNNSGGGGGGTAAAVHRLRLLQILPDDVLHKVTSFLDAYALLQMRACNRYCKELCSQNAAGWEQLCKILWSTKIHVPAAAVVVHKMTDQFKYMHAYRDSIQDAKERQYVTLQDLCYDAESHKGTVWSFRFKECAGEDWTTSDPWYAGLPCRKMVFLEDGSVRQYVPVTTTDVRQNDSGNEGSPVNHDSNHVHRSSNSISTSGSNSSSSSNNSSSPMEQSSDSESSAPELISPTFGNLLLEAQSQQQQQQQTTNTINNNNNPNRQQQRRQQQQQTFVHGRLLVPPVPMSWRFVTRPMDLPPTRHNGSYLRISVGGREVPTYSVRRSPTGNWGFIMESCWGLFASFELPVKQSVAMNTTTAAHDQHSPRQQLHRQRRRLRRTETGARWVDIMDDGEEALSPHGLHFVRSRQQPSVDASQLLEDEALEITNEVQWREAFLYNVGATRLPEGDGATDEFDRAFRGVP